jgi:hypothetical protein
MRAIGLIGILAVCGAAASADAFVVRCKFVYRVGTGTLFTDVPTVNGVQQLTVGVDVLPGQTVRIRKQFGVFDDATSAAPLGGYIGWNVGSESLTNGQTATRTGTQTSPPTNPRGRLAPFNFAGQPGADGNPATDPFTSLTDIDNTLGSQSPTWLCNSDGTVPPQPAATIRGRNTFISTWEFSTALSLTQGDFDVNMSGNLIVASGWGLVGQANPPDCSDPDPANWTAGAVTYAPQTLNPIPGSWVLRVRVVPAPGSMALLGLGGLIAGRRRRA